MWEKEIKREQTASGFVYTTSGVDLESYAGLAQLCDAISRMRIEMFGISRSDLILRMTSELWGEISVFLANGQIQLMAAHNKEHLLLYTEHLLDLVEKYEKQHIMYITGGTYKIKIDNEMNTRLVFHPDERLFYIIRARTSIFLEADGVPDRVGKIDRIHYYPNHPRYDGFHVHTIQDKLQNLGKSEQVDA